MIFKFYSHEFSPFHLTVVVVTSGVPKQSFLDIKKKMCKLSSIFFVFFCFPVEFLPNDKNALVPY